MYCIVLCCVVLCCVVCCRARPNRAPDAPNKTRHAHRPSIAPEPTRRVDLDLSLSIDRSDPTPPPPPPLPTTRHDTTRPPDRRATPPSNDATRRATTRDDPRPTIIISLRPPSSSARMGAPSSEFGGRRSDESSFARTLARSQCSAAAPARLRRVQTHHGRTACTKPSTSSESSVYGGYRCGRSMYLGRARPSVVTTTRRGATHKRMM